MYVVTLYNPPTSIEIEYPKCSFDSLEIEQQVINVWTILARKFRKLIS